MKTRIFFYLVLAFSLTASATTFTRIADTTTPIPGGVGFFTGFSAFDTPAIDDGKVVFRAFGMDAASNPVDGIYTDLNGSLEVVADTNTQIPGAPSGDTFDTSSVHGFGSPSISGANIVFKGDSDGAMDRGVYARFGANPLEVIADTRGSSLFSTLSSPAVSGDYVGFWTFVPSSGYFDGIYEHSGGPGGSIKKIADEGDVVFGKNNPIRYYDLFHASGVDQDGSETAFIARDTTGNYGLYSTRTIGSLFAISPRVYSGETAIPQAPGEVFNLQYTVSLSFDGGDIVFRGQNADFSVQGIYWYDTAGYTLSVVADLNTPVPGQSEPFSTFNDAAVDGPTDTVVFLAHDAAGNPGLYARYGGVLGKVIARNDELDGKVIDDLKLGHEGLDGNRAVFTAFFVDGSQGIYIADIDFTITKTPDLNQDGKVDKTDLVLFMNDWYQTGPDLPGDLNGDSLVNLCDFVEYSVLWH